MYRTPEQRHRHVTHCSCITHEQAETEGYDAGYDARLRNEFYPPPTTVDPDHQLHTFYTAWHNGWQAADTILRSPEIDTDSYDEQPRLTDWDTSTEDSDAAILHLPLHAQETALDYAENCERVSRHSRTGSCLIHLLTLAALGAFAALFIANVLAMAK